MFIADLNAMEAFHASDELHPIASCCRAFFAIEALTTRFLALKVLVDVDARSTKPPQAHTIERIDPHGSAIRRDFGRNCGGWFGDGHSINFHLRLRPGQADERTPARPEALCRHTVA